MPLLFGIQQFAEGAVWATFGTPYNVVATSAYLFFALSLWPVVVPFAVLRLETSQNRRAVLFPLALAGLALAAYLFVRTLNYPYAAEISGLSIRYQESQPIPLFVPITYYLVVCGTPLLSTKYLVNLLGICGLAAALAASRYFMETHLSVWCFFAAIISLIVIFQIRADAPKVPATA